MDACGLREYQAPRSQGHFVLPETLCECRGRIDEALMDDLIAIQAAAAMDAGLVSPAHLVIDTFPCEQGSQRVTDAPTLYKAQKKRSSGLHASPSDAAPGPRSSHAKPKTSNRHSKKSCDALGANAEGKGTSS